MKNLLRSLALLAVFTTGFIPVLQAGSSDHESGGEYKPGPVITHHISDSHTIHLFGDVHIPLPVILWTSEGLDVFMSSAFHYHEGHASEEVVERPNGLKYVMHHEVIYYAGDHGHDEHHALASTEHMAPEEHGEAHGEMVKPMDFSLTKQATGLWIIVILMIIIFRAAAKGYKRRPGQAPTGIQNLLEPMILFVRDDVAIPSIGAKKADRYVPFLLTLFFFIWLSNMLGLIPGIGGFNIMGTMGVTIVLAGFVWLITMFSSNGHYWGHILWPPGVPIVIKPLLIVIELVSNVIMKPAVLMIRLTANITAGHIIILAFASLVMIFGKGGEAVGAGIGVGIGATLFMVFMFFIELLVAFLQAYVFILLAAIYFGEATHEEHH